LKVWENVGYRGFGLLGNFTPGWSNSSNYLKGGNLEKFQIGEKLPLSIGGKPWGSGESLE